MTIRARVTFELLVVGLLGAALVCGVASWLTDGPAHQVLQLVMLLCVVLVALAGVASLMQRQPVYRVCDYCGGSGLESEGFDCVRGFVCGECCTRRTVVRLPKEAA